MTSCPRLACGGYLYHDGDHWLCSLCSRSPDIPSDLPYVSLSVLEGRRHQGSQSEWDAEQRARYRAEHREQLRAASLKYYYKVRDVKNPRKSG